MRVLMSIGGPTVFTTNAPADEILIGTANGVAWLARAVPVTRAQSRSSPGPERNVSTQPRFPQ